MNLRGNQTVDLDAILSPDARATRTRLALAKVRGLHFKDSFRGVFSVGSRQAQVCLEPGDALRVQMLAPLLRPPASTLAANSILPGNVRFARNGSGGELIADTKIDGEHHLSTSFRQIREGFRMALSGARSINRLQGNLRPLEKRQVQEALNQLNWEPDSIVIHDTGWELRPRVDAEAVPVALDLDGQTGELRFRRTVLPRLPAEDTVQVLACGDQALRLNAQLRWARLARIDDRLACEAKLHAGLVEPSWLAMTARAVAVACRYVQESLRVLAEQQSVAETYVRLLCTRGKDAAPDDAAE